MKLRWILPVNNSYISRAFFILLTCLILTVTVMSLASANSTMTVISQNEGQIKVVYGEKPAYPVNVFFYNIGGEVVQKGLTDEEGMFYYDADLSPVRVTAKDGEGNMADSDLIGAETTFERPLVLNILLVLGVLYFLTLTFRRPMEK